MHVSKYICYYYFIYYVRVYIVIIIKIEEEGEMMIGERCCEDAFACGTESIHLCTSDQQIITQFPFDGYSVSYYELQFSCQRKRIYERNIFYLLQQVYLSLLDVYIHLLHRFRFSCFIIYLVYLQKSIDNLISQMCYGHSLCYD